MTYGFENTTSDSSEISSILRLRRKPHIEKTVKASTFELAKKKAELEEKDGWSILQNNKKSIRMKKEKPFDENLDRSCVLPIASSWYSDSHLSRLFDFDNMKSHQHFELKNTLIEVLNIYLYH